jgi:cytochrome c peroxidase
MRAAAFSIALVVLPFVGSAPAQQIPPVPVPAGNPITPSKANLGKVLFFDEQLSSTRTVACATCHIASKGGSDPRAGFHPGADGTFGTADDVRGSLGVIATDANLQTTKADPFALLPQVTNRKAPSMINAAFSPTLFWDGRATPQFFDPVNGQLVLNQFGALESQAAGPPTSTVEMGHADRDWNEVAAHVGASTPLGLATNVPPPLATWINGRSYPQLFQEAFGSNAVTPVRIIEAIATYERTLVSNQAPIDAFNAGQQNALTPQQNQGRLIFNGPNANCAVCHAGPLFTNNSFQNIGVRPIPEDLGRGAVTGNPGDNGRFKVPSLRNVGLRGPYFHNGSAATLVDVVEFYNRGGDFHVNQNPLVHPLNLTQQQKDALVAFLSVALTDPRVASQSAPFDRPTLYTETDRVPQAFGAGAVGSGGVTPRFVAVEPPYVANPDFSFGIADTLGGAPVFLAIDVLAAAPGTTVGGVPLHLAVSPAFQLWALGNSADQGPGEGWLAFSTALPANPSVAGLTLFLQGFVVDVGAEHGVATTPGLSLQFFGTP